MTFLKSNILNAILLLISSPFTILALPTTEVKALHPFSLAARHEAAALNVTVAARQNHDPDGRLSCIPTQNPTECEIRATQYSFYDFITVEVYDPSCNEIDGGDKFPKLGTHVSIDSELPWTIELDVSSNWQTPPSGWYAGHALGMQWNQENGQLPVDFVEQITEMLCSLEYGSNEG
ncbi:hypothetical protein EG329_001455 [Mollisiaceae sp. DMI_Dod_QoI]|nr:hypothetical protein EG329_001455 [Helotiales sp. DMI_Dod_QoI]